MKEAKREVWLLASSDQIVTNIHPGKWCSGQCVVHDPSNHPLRELPLSFNMKLRAFFRTCEHGMFHQDPDERAYWLTKLESGEAVRLAMTKLSDFPCPTCECGCCDFAE